MKVFISGPMTGIEKYNFPKFLAMEEAIRKMGWKPVNPVHICRKYKEKDVLSSKKVFDKMIQEEMDALATCDTILLLKGWENSKGAKAEAKKALDLGLGIMTEDGLRSIAI